MRALSSVGRAPDLHSGGQEFDPPSVHHECRRKRFFHKKEFLFFDKRIRSKKKKSRVS